MAKKITVASYDIDIAPILRTIQELKNNLRGKEGILGKEAFDKSSQKIIELERQLQRLSKTTPGVGANAKDFEKFYKEVLKSTSGIDNLLSELKGFDISEEYLQKNIKALKDFAKEASEAAKNVSKAQKEAKSTLLGTYETEGEKRRSRDAESKMRNIAVEGSEDSKKRINEIKKTRSIEYDEAIAAAKNEGKADRVKSLIADQQKFNEAVKTYLELSKRVQKAKEKEKDAQLKLKNETENFLVPAQQEMKQVISLTDNISTNMHRVATEADRAGQEMTQLEQAGKVMGELSSRLTQFFSATTILYGLRRIVKGTVEDFKELDKQFNEIAIVSEYSTKEMWQNFESVNRVAQQFGVTTANVLEVQNLYYHQGKSMAEVNKLTAQTLTLAKITGMDYANATSNLTAVLNAYNIAAEDAVRVTDTIAAMDTNAAISSEELMTALTKTTSIAANAGMSLESTEVFLTKMIETTREAPENLGTALKTIIARFGEVKQQIDGEEIELADINRVDTALQSIGISLLDTAGQIRDLDDVFMELSSKWDDLDRNTQRYIATISAGSRQQSRFIAMMENYDRTLELTEISQNSAGLSAKQLEKAQESLETSTNRLKSSFQELTATWIKVGFFKGAIDGANNFVQMLNKIPMPMQAVIIGLSGWILKTQVLDRVLLAHKIIQDGLTNGLMAEDIALRLNNAKQVKRGGILSTLIHIGKIYRKTVERQGIAESAWGTALGKNEKKILASAVAMATGEVALEELNEETAENAVLNGLNGELLDKEKETKFAVALATLAQEKGLENLNEESLRALGIKTKLIALEEKENAVRSRGILIQKLRNAKGNISEAYGTGGVQGIKNVTGLKLKGLFTKGGAAAGGAVEGGAAVGGLSIGAALGIIAGVVAALGAAYLIYTKVIRASVDDKESIEKLADAQEKYNETLKNYKTLQKNAQKYEELRTKTFKTAEQLEEEQSIAEAIVEEYPHLLESIDEEGKYHLKNYETIQAEIAAKKVLAEQNAKMYAQMRLSYTKQGIYVDESSAAGAAMSNLQSYYSSMDKKTLKDVTKEIDKVGWFDGSVFIDFAEAYASGDKSSFGYKDFSNLFQGQITEEQFNKLAENFAKEGNIATALTESGAYTDTQIENIANVWEALNQNTGNLYTNLLSGIGEEVKNIYVTEANVAIDNALQETDANEKVKKSAQDYYSDIKTEEYNKQYEIAKANKQEAWSNLISNFSEGREDARQAVLSDGTIVLQRTSRDVDWKALWGNPSKIANEKAQELADEFMAELNDVLSDPEQAEKLNDFYNNIGGKTLGELQTLQSKLKDKDDAISLIENQELNKQIKLLDNFIEKIKELNLFIEGSEEKINLVGFIETLTGDQIKRLEEIYAQMGNEAGAEFTKGLEAAQKKGININDLLKIDLTDIDSLVAGMQDAELSIDNCSEAIAWFISAMGGVDAVLFKDLEEGAEKLQKRIEKLTDSLEKISKLEAGEGGISEIATMLKHLDDMGQLENSADVKAFVSRLTWTNEGAKYVRDSGKTYVDSALDATGIEVGTAYNTIEGLEEKRRKGYELTAKEQEQYEDAIQTAALGTAGIEQILYEEWKARQEGIVKGLQKEVDKLKEVRDAYADLVEFIRGYDYYQNLDRQLEQLGMVDEKFKFEIEFSTNEDVIADNLTNRVNTINNEIAANLAGQRAADENASMYRDSIEKNYGNYASFDSDGTIIVNQEKMFALQQKITAARVAGRTEEAALLEEEKKGIEASIQAYTEAQKKSNDYAKDVRENFKELEAVLDSAYQSRAKAEEKIYEIIKDKEDKELDNLKKKYDTMKKENADYLDSVRKMVDKERQIRDRQNREQDVADKEKKLAMMKMDTSGVYKNQIQQLEKELAQDYQDLEDDAIDSRINDIEEEHNRQTEIWDKEVEYLENSLEEKREHYSNYQAEVNEILMKGSDEATAWIIANDEKFLAETQSNQVLLRKDYQKTMADAVAANEFIGSSLIEKVSRNLERCRDSAKIFENAAIQYGVSTTASNDGVSKSVKKLSNDYYALTGRVKGLDEAEGNLKGAIGDVENAVNRLNNAQQAQYTLDYNRVQTMIDKYKELAEQIKKINELKELQNSEVAEKSNYQTKLVTDFAVSQTPTIINNENYYYYGEDKQGNGLYVKEEDTWVNAVGTRILKAGWKKDLYYLSRGGRKYAEGGIADFTGPAWLDGTRSKPEAVLNPAQTKTFIQFTNVLDSIFSEAKMPKTHQAITQAKEAIYNFTIKVDQMASDYDVDKLVDRIQEKMAKDSQYRNVTILKKRN